MRLEKRVLLAVAAVMPLLLAAGDSVVRARPTKIRWDIVSVNFAAVQVSEGGNASARADDGTKITITGSGTFSVRTPSFTSVFSATSASIEMDAEDQAASGGNWTITSPNGAVVGSGTYRVVGPISFIGAPGRPGGPLTGIGRPEDRRAGLANLYIAYSDGSEGILVVSCQGDVTPRTVFEGITVSKGYVTFYDAERPVPGIDTNRTLFIIQE